MKMTQLLWRIVSVCLCVAVVCRYPDCYVGCTESDPEVQRPEFSQDITSEEESEKTAPHPKSLSENEQQIADDRPKSEQTTQEVDLKQHAEPLEADQPDVEVELEAEQTVPQPEEASEDQHPEGLVSQNQEPGPLRPSPVSAVPAVPTGDPSVPNPDEDIPNSVSGEAPDVADADLPLADCVEERNNPYDGDSPPLVLENTANAHTVGTKTHTEPPLSPPAVPSAKYLDSNASHALKEPALSSPGAADTDSSASSRDPEDIPTFDEWKRKMMEVEKEKTLTTHTSNNGGPQTVKKVQKNFNNYASVECGAKILGANPEAKGTSAILMENKDMYMLNPCSNKIWFIIELCEPIQVKQLDIANFELFSSMPKDFLVSISDRYPTNKWLKLGTFHARDERTVQSFPLDEHLYAKYVKMFTKYIKVELVSYFGSEHFCPLSLIRVFGTSMVEEYEENAEPSERTEDQDDDLDYPPGSTSGEVKLPKNLIGSAKDAILDMVSNIAVNVLGTSSDMKGNLSSEDVNMTEPSQQPETSPEAVTTDLTTVPDTEEVQIFQDSDVPPTAAPSSETPAADSSEQTLPQVEEKIVIPLEKDEEEPVRSTVTLMDEEESEENKDKKGGHDPHEESQKCCPPSASASPSCSCAASLQESVQRQCSAFLSKKRKCQTMGKKQKTPHIKAPAWELSIVHTACPEPRPQHTEAHQPPQGEPTTEGEPGRDAAVPEAPQAAGQTEPSAADPIELEPSQTTNLPKPSDSSSARPTPAVDTPPPSSEEPPTGPGSDKSPEVWIEEGPSEPSASLSSSVQAKPSVPEDEASEERPSADAPPLQAKSPTHVQGGAHQPSVLLPTPSLHPEHLAEPTAAAEIGPASTEAPPPDPDSVTEPEPAEDPPEDTAGSSAANGQPLRPPSPSPSSAPSPSLSDIYAEPFNGSEQNGNQVHGSSQRESVFMRLNNRIKTLEVNMSLSGRYLEQLSQRYRKQMEEMQRAFNKTIIKLQNTSRIAEEQDLRQTESIQLLQGQLENVTQLVLNLSLRVSQLQIEVSDRQNYLLLSLLLCLCLGLLLCINHCRITAPSTTEPDPPTPKSYTFSCPERSFSFCDETGLKRSASYPLIHSETLQLATTEGPEMLHAEETQSLCPQNRKRRRRRLKPVEKVETLKPFQAAPELSNGAAVCNGAPCLPNPAFLAKRLLHPAFRDSPSEGSSEGSSHSDDPSFCGIATACSRLCDGLPPAKTRAEKRALRRRRPKPGWTAGDPLLPPLKDKSAAPPVTLQDITNSRTERKPVAPLTGPV
ncbi:SUN domain-containing ossification factor isoform 2-T2 [Menidia menidia]